MKVFILNLAVGLAILLGLIFLFYRKKFTNTEKIFGYFLITNALFEIIAKVSNVIGFNNNLPGLHAYTLVKFIILCSFFGAVITELGNKFKWKNFLIAGSLLIILNSIFIQDIYSFNSYSSTLVELFVVLASISIFLLKLKPNLKIQIGLKPIIIFTTACFVKSCFSIMIYLYSTEIIKLAEELGVKIWLVNGIINITFSCLILIGITFIIKRKEKPIFIEV